MSLAVACDLCQKVGHSTALGQRVLDVEPWGRLGICRACYRTVAAVLESLRPADDRNGQIQPRQG